jgi:hypothetical protein
MFVIVIDFRVQIPIAGELLSLLSKRQKIQITG